MALKLPSISFGPKPKKWDLVAAGVLVLGGAVAMMSWLTAAAQEPGSSIPGETTAFIVLAQLAICMGSLMLLGKTAKEGTIWGNLAAIGGTFAGLSGVLLAAALWAAA